MASWYGSDLLVDRLAELGIEHVALNPGATIRGLHDSLVNPPGRSPTLLLALHENIAVAMAHGYAKAAGKPMAVGLHDTVGLLNGSMGIFNAFVDRAPMLLLAGTGPLDVSERRPWLDWIHTVGEQGAIVRDMTVWNEQPTTVDGLLRAVVRAMRTILRGPQGPGLIGVDISLQELEVGPPDNPEPYVLQVGRIGPDPHLIEGLVRDLRAARRPLLVTDRPLSADASSHLLRLAKQVGAGLIDLGGGSSFPVGHPHDVTEGAIEALRVADHVTFIDVRDPSFALGSVNLATRRTEGVDEVPVAASIGLSSLMNQSWIVTESPGPERIDIIADPALALGQLTDAFGNQRRELNAAFKAIAAKGTPPLPAPLGVRGLHRGHVGRVLANALSGKDWVLAHGAFGGWARRTLRFQRPDQFLGLAGGAGLGYGPGAALGAALALRNSGRITLSLQSDGELLYTPQALWTAAHEGLPVLMMVDANRTYGKDEQHQRVLARERGRPEENVGHGILLDDPVIDMASLARSFGVPAEGPVDNLADLEKALGRAVELVSAGEPVLVEVRTAPD